jgi:enoyl-CoA hydratase
MSDSVQLTTEGDVAVISLDDGKANALSFDVLDGLDAALTQAESSAKAVVINGRDGKFSAGFDLKVMTGDADGARRMLGAGALLGLRIYTFPIPVVLGVTGHALAMGGILTTTADYRVGADGPYKLGLNEVAIGMPVPSFGVELCRDRLSPAWFTRCVQHATLCTPAEAVAAGFLDEVVALDAVPERTLAVATQLAETVHPGPFRMTRETIRGELHEELKAGLERDLGAFSVSG